MSRRWLILAAAAALSACDRTPPPPNPTPTVKGAAPAPPPDAGKPAIDEALLNGLVTRIRERPHDYATFRRRDATWNAVRLLDASPKCLFVRVDDGAREVPWRDVHPEQVVTLVRDYWPDVSGEAMQAFLAWAEHEGVGAQAAGLLAQRLDDRSKDDVARLVAEAERALALEDTIKARALFERALTLRNDDDRAIMGLARTAELERAIAARPKAEPEQAPAPEPEPKPKPSEGVRPPDPPPPQPALPAGVRERLIAAAENDGTFHGTLSISPDGSAAAWTVSVEKGQAVVVNGVRKSHAYAIRRPFAWMDGGVFVYVEVSGTGSGRQHVVVGGRHHDAFSAIKGLAVSDDARHLAYLAVQDADPEKGQNNTDYFVVVDGSTHRYDFASSPVYPPHSTEAWYRGALTGNDGRTKAYVFAGATRKREVRNDDYESVSDLTFSGDGKRMAYAVWSYRRKQGTLQIDYKTLATFTSLAWHPALSDDGKVWAVVVRKPSSELMRVEVGGKRGADYDEIWPPVLNADGRSVAYFAKLGGEMILVHDSKARPLGGEAQDHSPALSRDGRHVAGRVYADRTWFVMVDDRRLGPYQFTDAPVFSQDGRSVSFGARRGFQMLWVTVDLE